MKVCVLVTDAFGSRGGIAKFNRDLLTCLCSYPSTQEVIVLPRKIVEPVNVLPSKLTHITSATNGKVQFSLATIQTILESRFDLIICGHINFLPLVSAIHAISRVPWLLVLHGIEAWQPSPSALCNSLARYVSTTLSVSELTYQRFMQWARSKQNQPFILPNSVQLENYAPGLKSDRLLNQYHLAGKTVLLTLGRLDSKERYKGFDEVVEALPRLRTTLPDLCYVIAGDGPDRPRLEAKVQTLNLQDCVIFTGYVPEAEKADYYRLADAFLMPSRGEGFGIVLLEAMACGIPVMASKLDGSREALLNGKLGILVDPTDPDEVYRGILETLKRPKEVPEALGYFSFENFEQRCHAVLDHFYRTA